MDDLATHPRSHEIDSAVAADSVRMLFRNSRTPLIANLVVSAGLVTMLWPQPSPATLLAWAAAVWLLTALRGAVVFAFLRKKPDDAETRTWGYAYTLFAFLSGVTWSTSSMLFLMPDDLTTESLVILTSFGMAMGSVSAHASFFPATLAYTLTSIVPLLGALMLEGGKRHLSMAALGSLFLVVLLLSARNQYRTLRKSFRLNHQNAALARELMEAKRVAESASRAKSDFLANMSHEIRTPLTAINGFSEMLKDEVLGPLGNPRYREYAGDIHESGLHLLAVINDILDLSKAEAGKLTLDIQPVDVHRLVESALRLVRMRAQQSDLAISVHLPEHPAFIKADPRALKQILLNLLTNSVKFTPAGGNIALAAEFQEDRLVMAVKDTGIGMSPDDVPTALSPFGQLASPMSRKHEGTGLGLPLVKTLVTLHGGTLDIETAPGKGTTVTVRLPACIVNLPRMAAPSQLAG